MFRCLSVSTLGVGGGQSELIELALSNGFKGLDFDVVEFESMVKASDLAKARRFIDSAKLKLGVFALPVDWQHDDEAFKRDMTLLPGRARLAVELGCRRAVTTVFPGSNDRPIHQNFDFYRRRLLELAAVLDSAGVLLGVGFDAASDRREGYAFEFIRQLDTLMMIMSMAPAKSLGYVVDPWQVCAGGGSLDSLKKIPVDKISAVFLADAAEEMPANQWTTKNRVLPGLTGIVDNTSVLTWLGEIGYEGPVVPAPDPSALGGQRRDAIVRQASEKLDGIWKAAGLNPLGKLTPAAAK